MCTGGAGSTCCCSCIREAGECTGRRRLLQVHRQANSTTCCCCCCISPIDTRSQAPATAPTSQEATAVTEARRAAERSHYTRTISLDREVCQGSAGPLGRQCELQPVLLSIIVQISHRGRSTQRMTPEHCWSAAPTSRASQCRGSHAVWLFAGRYNWVMSLK